MPGRSPVSVFLFYAGFTTEFTLALAAVCPKLGRRSLFALRAVVCAAALVSSGLLWSVELSALEGLVILRYSLMFALGFGCVFACFRVSPWTALYCAVAGYVMQHVAYRLSYPILYFGATVGVPGWLALVLYSLVFVAVYVAGYMFIGRRLRHADELFAHDPRMIVLAFIVMACVIVFSSMYDPVVGDDGTRADFVVAAFDCMCCLFILGTMYYMLRDRRGRSEFDYYRRLWEKEKQQYEISRETVELINIKCHDLRRYVQRLRGGDGLLNERDLDGMDDLLGFYDRSVRTGNEVIDVVLAERVLRMEKSDVRMSCMVDGALFSHIRPADLYSLFANILDNALAALEKTAEERRVLSLTASASMGMVFLHAENRYDGEVRTGEDGLPITDKSDKAFHGFGIRSIMRVARDYGGEASVSATDGVFSVDCVLPLPPASDGS